MVVGVAVFFYPHLKAVSCEKAKHVLSEDSSISSVVANRLVKYWTVSYLAKKKTHQISVP